MTDKLKSEQHTQLIEVEVDTSEVQQTHPITFQDNSSDAEQEQPISDAKPEHPIAEAITRYLHRARDIKWSCSVFTPAAAKIMKDRYSKAEEQMKGGQLLLASKEAIEQVHGMKDMLEAMRKIQRISYSRIPEVIETSLFLSLFTAFDAYTGELISALYERKPELFSKLNRQVELSEVLMARSIEDLKRTVLEDVIESFRRKSYIEQFAELEKSFGITLKAFNKWSAFVECTQRRNLLTHCGGVISEQYYNICLEEGYPKNDIPAIGSKLGLGSKYFLETCELMIEVGLKLGQSLWRKILPSEIAEADAHLHDTQYEALYNHNWARAKVFGEFAVKQREFSNELAKRLSLINYCIALKFSGDEENAKKELHKVDWTASINDFKLAEAILEDRFEDAASLMIIIGKSGVYISENGYHSWPLLHTFREKPEFMAAYEKIYGHAFVSKLKRSANAALTNASAKKNEVEIKSREDLSSELNDPS